MSRRVLCPVVPVVCVMVGCLAAAAGAQSDESVVARVGDHAITRAALLQVAAGSLAPVRQEEYRILRMVLDRMIQQDILTAAAARDSLSVEAFIAAHVDSLVADPTDAEGAAFYDQNRTRLSQLSPQEARATVREHLRNTRRRELFDQLLADLKRDAGVVTYLEPPRVAMEAGDNPSLGPDTAAVTLVAFLDYECPYCRQEVPVLDALRVRYGDRLRLVCRDFPLPSHRNSAAAHAAAGCAFEQGKFWDMHQKLYQNQRDLAPERIREYAAEVGLDLDAFDACLASGRRNAEVASDVAAGQAAGVAGTPAFFLNGRLLSGAQSLEALAQVIDEELSLGSVAVKPTSP